MDVVTYALLKKQINSILPGYTYKGGVALISDLPLSGTTGDLYTVGNLQYVWNGTEWIEIGVQSITEAQIDALF